MKKIRYIITEYDVQHNNEPVEHAVIEESAQVETTFMGKYKYRQRLIALHANTLGVEEKTISVDLSYKVVKGGQND